MVELRAAWRVFFAVISLALYRVLALGWEVWGWVIGAGCDPPMSKRSGEQSDESKGSNGSRERSCDSFIRIARERR